MLDVCHLSPTQKHQLNPRDTGSLTQCLAKLQNNYQQLTTQTQTHTQLPVTVHLAQNTSIQSHCHRQELLKHYVVPLSPIVASNTLELNVNDWQPHVAQMFTQDIPVSEARKYRIRLNHLQGLLAHS